MEPFSRLDANGTSGLEVLSEDSGFIVGRRRRDGAEDGHQDALIVLAAAEQPTPTILNRLAHEYSLKDELDSAWAVRPLELVQDRGRAILVLEDPGGLLLSALLGTPMEIGRFLRIAVGITGALGKLHQQKLIHKDIKPANILVNAASDEVRLTGFRSASRLTRERQSVEPPEFIAGTLAYMAPEQTGRMNRSIDSRCDLYSLGVTFYEMLTGTLPFTASDPMEWVHCHIARQPHTPRERSSAIPLVLSSIVMKLLAKTAEERYQTAAGVEADLRLCLNDWQTYGEIRSFSLGSRDASNRFSIPEKLYGRKRELEQLFSAFDRSVANGRPGLLLVSGYAGVGKSSIVNELQKVLLPPRGIFASGKFDQNRGDIPYATFAQVLQRLVGMILAERETELARYREAILDAVEPYGQFVVNLIPELERVIGKQPQIADISPQDAKRVCEQVLRRFIGVFARREHPLALFLDDLQWLDTATLDMLQHLLLHEETEFLFVVGAYRDNEVDSQHPLLRCLDVIRGAGVPVSEIRLAPLTLPDVRALIAETLRDNDVRPLAELVHGKTAGNPLFATQFLTALADDGLIAFDSRTLGWNWDGPRITARGFTDNIVALMIEKITRLPASCREAMQAMACISNTVPIGTLAAALDMSVSEAHMSVRPAVDAGLVAPLSDAYTFLHDRIQEASYALIAGAERPSAHLRVGRRLLAGTAPEKLDENVFDIVNQFNRGIELVSDRSELDQVAELNMRAGQRAKAATAYTTALTHFRMGAAALGEAGWQRRHAVAFAIASEQGECEFLTGDLDQAEVRLSALVPRAAGLLDLAAIACLRIMLYVTRGDPARSVEICLEYLENEGTHFSPHPSREDVEAELDRMWRALGERSIEDLALLPAARDAGTLATLDVLAATASPAWFSDQLLPAMLAARIVNISIERGYGSASSFGYAMLAMKLGPFSGDYRTAYRFGKLALELAERGGNPRTLARVLFGYAMFVRPWADTLDGCRELVRRGFEAAERAGDLTYATYLLCNVEALMLMAGSPLGETEAACKRALEYARKLNFDFAGLAIQSQLGLTRMLRGDTIRFGSFDNPEFDQNTFERTYGGIPVLALPMCWYWVRRQQALFLAGDPYGSVKAAESAEPLLWVADVYLEFAEHHFYAALARAECLDSTDEGARPKLRERLEANLERLKVFGENSPVTLGSRATLAAAEFARVGGRERDAMELYEHAIRSARAAGFVHIEALCFELAARFYATRGFETIASSYRREARAGYMRWGADGKVRQIERLYPDLAAPEEQRPAVIMGSPAEYLDVASVVKASQAVSSEIELPKLIERLMTIAIENVGADRGLLILPSETEYRIEAEARATGDQVEVTMRQEAISGTICPESLIRYVIRTQERVILDDASKPNLFSADGYLRDRTSKSILCLPLIKHQELAGILLLENTLTSHAFTADRIAVLELLAAQAAISLENTRLYDDLREREAKIRRLIDSNIIGMCVYNLDRRILEANDAFLDMLGYSRDDVISGRLSLAPLTPPEWAEDDARRLAELVSTGIWRPSEKEFFRKDGTRVPVLIGSATFGERRHEGVAFVVDLTERKQAEAALREAERRSLDAQMQLAHANRVATMGQLAASIAHEVNQPIAATLMNAGTALRWLAASPPELNSVKRTLDRIIIDGQRAADIIGRIRDFSRTAPAQAGGLKINEVILEVIGLTRSEMSDKGVSVRTRLADGLPAVLGDRVQLQQVILNLIMNAVEAMNEIADGPRELLISSDAETNGVLIDVHDSGPGLPQANPERVFDAFYTTKARGLGMGLSICRSIVQAHGGQLSVAPNKPRGTIFRIVLPATLETL